ncbi:hypothetical protein Bpfe_011139 [Biomphalaria pfeifferi]|uniref:Uncharacterized protein n=1 Tax=Biomphalaria pfeifferi TaxID=112525 RepID=A0AAD8BT62_BIOPF|nr:hypothetical protein Bpfe_011139 [Biomphalaria pfeifferi]
MRQRHMLFPSFHNALWFPMMSPTSLMSATSLMAPTSLMVPTSLMSPTSLMAPILRHTSPHSYPSPCTLSPSDMPPTHCMHTARNYISFFSSYKFIPEFKAFITPALYLG